MTLSVMLARFIRKQRLTITHYMYFALIVWVLVLVQRHFRHPAVTTIHFVGTGGDTEGKITHLVLPSPKKFVAAEAYRALKTVRDNMLKEFIGVDLPPWLDDPANETQPKLGEILEPRQTRRVIVLTTWRSGSTFLGDLLNAWPGAYYHFEPLHFLAEREIIPRHQEPLAVGLLKTLLTCHFDQRITPYLYYITSARYNFLLKKNVRLNSLCRGRGLCQDPGVMATACAFHPLNFAKTVRLRLAAVKSLLEDTSLDVRVVHLVRDPRGVVNSRLKMPWCSGKTCRDMSNVCRAVNQDAYTSQEFRSKYPRQYLLQRYEDLVDDPYRQTRKIFEFLELPLVEELAAFIEEHMNTEAKRNERGDDYTYAAQFSTYRNSSSVATRWRFSLGMQKVQEIQSLCRPALRYYGYRSFSEQYQLHNFNMSVIEAQPGRSFLG
ncbi:carbohydrate sulfotransferase 1-like [Penaeus chinensis]|uniref:carbohydrate sulfotransferase 1-like n=1 Tax=Penaeus chinensis TaxID=139456 RepID=UPI001FB6071A|nr:carbohydrate sulfotransferase 1-like [Penaeus chinensis]XP_047487711.1 carbohydrate sulfotransferase 1-like [Penaeus chinensis]XP_047487712.1 carbohydrate sulfotransferase 1-like [Penaeus chinensis]